MLKILYGKALNNINRMKMIADLISSIEKNLLDFIKTYINFCKMLLFTGVLRDFNLHKTYIEPT